MKKDMSPEEKLLRLIKEPRRKNDAGTAPSAGRGAAAEGGVPTLPLKSGAAAEGGVPVGPSVPGLKCPFLPHLEFSFQKTAAVFFMAACVYSSLVFARFFSGGRPLALPRVKEADKDVLSPGPEITAKPYEFYEAAIKARPLFGAIAAPEVASPKAAVDIDVTKEINLVGIISGVNPQAAIEDKKTQKTYYVTRGQWIGEFQVEDILEGRIVLICNGQRFELSL